MERTKQHSVYLAGDVNAIKDFVFETSSLPQIRGGSELLQECEETIRGPLQKQYDYQVIYCGGGSFLLKVADDRAEEIQRAIENLYWDTTQIATVTIVREEEIPNKLVPPTLDGWAGRLVQATKDTWEVGEFSRRMTTLIAHMREAKDLASISPFYEAFPFGRRCDRCGKRMASYRDRVDETKYLCAVCELRDKLGREKKSEIHGQDIRGKFNQKFWRCWGQNFTAKQPDDLEAMLGTSRRKYLAFIYADGNDIGYLLQQARSEEEYEALSYALREGTEEALFEALEHVCAPALSGQRYWPFDIVNIGGDDMTLLIQAGYAWEVAVEFLKRFEQEVNSRIRKILKGAWPEAWPKQITASCGIAIADAKYPIRHLEHLATGLLKEAKQVAKKEAKDPCSAVSFLWLPTPIISEEIEPLMEIYKRKKYELIARPYRLDQAEAINQLIHQTSRWPRVLRHRWAEALESGILTSVNTIFYDLARRQGEQREQFHNMLQEMERVIQGTEGQGHLPPIWWVKSDENGYRTYQTALLDILELAELHAMRPDAEEETE